jgi:cellulose synthase/poly-beta-1,6-N-acetylglucosamine synthase-like glycosyltransferase
MRPSPAAKRVTVAFVHYKTPDLLEKAVRSFKSFYPEVPTVIFDNGSGKPSSDLIHRLIQQYAPSLQAHFSEVNLYHGPAMNRLMKLITTEFVFFLDTDTVTRRGGFLEPMCDIFDKSDRIYGVGQVITVNSRGFPAPQGIRVLVSAFMMLRARDYHLFPRFEHHGLPVMRHLNAAAAQGYELEDFPIKQYVHHFLHGTAARYGYGLGLKSKVDFVLNKLGL